MNALFVAIKPQNISLAQLLPGFNMSVSLSFSLILSLALSTVGRLAADAHLVSWWDTSESSSCQSARGLDDRASHDTGVTDHAGSHYE